MMKLAHGSLDDSKKYTNIKTSISVGKWDRFIGEKKTDAWCKKYRVNCLQYTVTSGKYDTFQSGKMHWYWNKRHSREARRKRGHHGGTKFADRTWCIIHPPSCRGKLSGPEPLQIAVVLFMAVIAGNFTVKHWKQSAPGWQRNRWEWNNARISTIGHSRAALCRAW